MSIIKRGKGLKRLSEMCIRNGNIMCYNILPSQFVFSQRDCQCFTEDSTGNTDSLLTI